MATSASIDFACGGYLLVRPAPRAGYMSAELLPERILSVSGCVCVSVSGEWTARPEAAREGAEAFGLRPAARDRATARLAEALSRGDLGWPNLFATVEKARIFRSEALPSESDVVLLGFGLPWDCCDEFLQESAPAPGMGVLGAHRFVAERRPLAPGGRVLGFEVLGLDFGGFHSFACNSLETVFRDSLEVSPNGCGFIDTEAEARRCAELARSDEAGAEPALWQPWVVIRYDSEM